MKVDHHVKRLLFSQSMHNALFAFCAMAADPIQPNMLESPQQHWAYNSISLQQEAFSGNKRPSGSLCHGK